MRLFVLCFFTIAFFKGFSQRNEIADSLVNEGNQYYKECNYPEAIHFFLLATKNIKKSNSLLPRIYGKIGNVYEDLSNYDKSLKYYQLSYDAFLQQNDSIGIASALNQTGNIYYRWGNLNESLTYYETALNIQKNKNDRKGMSSTLNNIGNIYYSWQNFDKALQKYFEVLKIKKQLKDSTELTNNLINIGSTYLGLKDFDKAEKYYREALALTQKENDKNMMANCLLNMGVLSFEQGKYSKALLFYQQAYDLLFKLNNKLGLATVFRNLAETKMKTGDFNQAENYLQQSIKIAHEENMSSLISECYFFYYKIYKQKKDYKKALDYYIQYSVLNDSLFNEQAMKQLANIQTRYQTEKKEKDIQKKTLQIAKKEKQLRIQLFWFVLIITVLVLFAFFLIYFLKNKSRIKQKMLEEEINLQRQQALSAQMNPHFISNALNSIQKYFLNNDFEKANEFLADFGALIRKILENSRKNFILLKDELTYLKLYLSLEALRLDNKFSYAINLPDDLDNTIIKIPPLIIQPYVENAIWHGIAPNQKTGKIEITIFNKENRLYCVIQDDGIGINRSKMENMRYAKKKKSLALDITKERLRLLSRSSKMEFTVTINDLSDSDVNLHGTKVEIQMPLTYG